MDAAVTPTPIIFTELSLGPPGVMIRMLTAYSCCSLLASCPRFTEATSREADCEDGMLAPHCPLAGWQGGPPAEDVENHWAPAGGAVSWKSLPLCERGSQAGGREVYAGSWNVSVRAERGRGGRGSRGLWRETGQVRLCTSTLGPSSPQKWFGPLFGRESGGPHPSSCFTCGVSGCPNKGHSVKLEFPVITITYFVSVGPLIEG